MNDQDILNNLILTHWNRYCPALLAQFRRENRLEKELKAKKQSITDLMHELTIVQKMSYPAAWEVAIHELLEPEEEELSSTNQSQS